MIGRIFSTIGTVTGKVTEAIKQKRELKLKAEEMQFGYLKERMTSFVFTCAALTFIIPVGFWILSPILKHIPGMEGVLKDYETIINTIGMERIFYIVTSLLGVGGVGKMFGAVGKIKLAARKQDAETEIKKEQIKAGTFGDDYVKLDAKEKAPRHVKEFIKDFKDYAIMLEKEYKLPANAVLAHAALETYWGKEILKGWDNEQKKGRKICSNSMFNIKAFSNWDGKKVFKKGALEYDKNGKKIYVPSWFRAYDSPKESFIDYGKLITTNERYQPADKADDPYEYVKALKACGYQTDIHAVKSMMDIMKKYIDYET